MKPLQERIKQANAALAPYAVSQDAPLGKIMPEDPDETRFPFQRDRDRILHTQSFRRLKHKTQVFVSGTGDHYRTRLTHTLEVAQISRGMARTLQLNEDLAECIALAHDLGHTPFGHAGEEAMNEEMKRHGASFEHNAQSLRIVTLLETRTERYRGLNLNREVLEGMMKHQTIFDHGADRTVERAPSLEAQIVNLADEIAYTAHDCDDGLRAGMLRFDDLTSVPLFAHAATIAKRNGTEVRGALIHILVMDAYGETEHRLKSGGIQTLDDVYCAGNPIVGLSDETGKALCALRAFLWENLYNNPRVRAHSQRGKEVIQSLFRSYENTPPKKVLELQRTIKASLPDAIKDYIAGMTDEYAMEKEKSIRNTNI